MRVEVLRKAEVTHLIRRVERALHAAEDERVGLRPKRVVGDGGDEGREVLRVADVAGAESERRERGGEVLHLRRVRRLVESRENVYAAIRQLCRHGLVRGDHALLDHLVRDVVFVDLDSGHAPFGVEENLAFRQVEVERAGLHARLPELGGQGRASLEKRLGLRRDDVKSFRRASLDDGQGLLVVESQLGADFRTREATRKDASGVVVVDEDGEAEPVLVGPQAADAVRELLGEHRDDLVDEVHACAALGRLAVERAALADVEPDVRDVDAERPRAVGRDFERNGVVIVARRGGVDGQDELLAEVEALAGAAQTVLRRCGLLEGRRREVAGKVVLAADDFGVERRLVGRADDVDDFAFEGCRVRGRRKAHDHAVALLRAGGVGNGDVAAVDGVERDDKADAPRNVVGADDETSGARFDADDARRIGVGAVVEDAHGDRVARERALGVPCVDAVGLSGFGVRDEPRAASDEFHAAGDEILASLFVKAWLYLLERGVRDEAAQRGVHELRAMPAETEDVADVAGPPLPARLGFDKVADLVRDFIGVHS